MFHCLIILCVIDNNNSNNNIRVVYRGHNHAHEGGCSRYLSRGHGQNMKVGETTTQTSYKRQT